MRGKNDLSPGGTTQFSRTLFSPGKSLHINAVRLEVEQNQLIADVE